jgi:hypothetical protein
MNCNTAVIKVNELLEKFIGGEIFFDQLDDSVRTSKEILEAIYNDVKARYPHNKYKYVVTGKTGIAYFNYGFTTDLIVPGGLRKSNTRLDLSEYVKAGENYVLIDDSYFMGRTEAVIRKALNECGASLAGTLVFYDGCIEKRPWVTSMYRYYDNYDVLGNRLEK